MADDQLFQYLKLITNYIPFWLVLLIILAAWLLRNPEVAKSVPKYLSTAKIGDFELEFREVKQEIKAARQQVEELQNEIELQGEARVREILDGFDAHAPVSDLSSTRQAIQAAASSLENLDFVRKGLAQIEDVQALFAAAEIARTRRDIGLFDDMVACLDRLSKADDLHGVRFQTVWTLTSALHKTLIAELKHSKSTRLTSEQLEFANVVLDRLLVNPKVLEDRPDNPSKGIRGPAKWAKSWVEKALAERNDL